MKEQQFFVNDKDTTDITIDLGNYKNNIVTVSNKTIMNIAHELQKSGNVEMAFIEGMGIVPTLSTEEDKELTRQAQADREEKERHAAIIEENDMKFDEHKEEGAEDWKEQHFADQAEREMNDREIEQELNREESL